MKKTRMDKELDDAVELFESAYHIVPSYDAETGGTRYHNTEVPKYRSVRRLKRRQRDYRPGPVKVYTAEEIVDYVKSKALSD